MHELGLATAVVDACAERAAGARVLRVRVEVGQLVAVLPDSLRFCFDVCARGTLVEGAELEILETPGRAVCATAATASCWRHHSDAARCGGSLRIVAGEELRVKDMEIA